MECTVCIAVTPTDSPTFFLKKVFFIPNPQIGMCLYHLTDHEDFPSEGMKVKEIGYSVVEKIYYVYLEEDRYVLSNYSKNPEWEENYTQQKLREGLYAGWENDDVDEGAQDVEDLDEDVEDLDEDVEDLDEDVEDEEIEEEIDKQD